MWSTSATGGDEHSHYLDQLARIAIDSEVTHVVTLHLDSFPVRSDWVERLVNRLSERTPFASVEGNYTACMMFTREFYVRCNPTFKIMEIERSRPEFIQYMTEWNPVLHSGVGYAFRAYNEGLSGIYLRPSLMPPTRFHLGRIYDDIVFHLEGASKNGQVSVAHPLLCRWGGSAIKIGCTLARTLIPARARLAFRQHFREEKKRLLDKPRKILWQKQKRPALEELFANPEAYFDRMRTNCMK